MPILRVNYTLHTDIFGASGNLVVLSGFYNKLLWHSVSNETMDTPQGISKAKEAV